MGFNPMAGRKPKPADLVILFVALGLIAALVAWAIAG